MKQRTSCCMPDSSHCRRVQRRRSRCLRTEVGARQASDWREVQANIGMGSLLLPRPGVVNAVRKMLVAERVIPPVPAAAPMGYRLIGELTRRFAVSRQVARIRLIGMGLMIDAEAAE